MIIKRKPLKFTSRVGIVFENPVIRRKDGRKEAGHFPSLAQKSLREKFVGWDDGGGGGS